MEAQSLCAVKETELTDGSTVYDVIIGRLLIHCPTEKDAWAIYEAINTHAIGITD